MSNFINMQSLTRKSTNGQLIEENKIEEKRIETKEKENYSQNYIALFNDDDIATWLMKTGNEKIQDALYKKYNHSFLTEETINAFNWNLENNKKRKAGTFLKGWMERSNNPDKISQANKEQAIIDKFPNLFGRD